MLSLNKGGDKPQNTGDWCFRFHFISGFVTAPNKQGRLVSCCSPSRSAVNGNLSAEHTSQMLKTQQNTAVCSGSRAKNMPVQLPLSDFQLIEKLITAEVR